MAEGSRLTNGRFSLSAFAPSSVKPPGHDVECNTVSEKRGNCVLWMLKPRRQKKERLKIINRYRKLEQIQGVGDRNRDRVTATDPMVEESFFNHHRRQEAVSGTLYDRQNLLESLADFGIKALTQPEKIALHTVLLRWEREHDGVKHGRVCLADYCRIIEEARSKMRAARFSTVFGAWRTVDIDGTGLLGREHVLNAFLEELGLSPRNDDEAAAVDAVFTSLRKDWEGKITLAESEHLVQQVREHLVSNRRNQERRIQDDFFMEESTFSELRSQLTELRSAFISLEILGVISMDNVINLLCDFGFVASMTEESRATTEQIIQDELGTKDRSSLDKINFPQFLEILLSFRRSNMQKRREEVECIFNDADKDVSGDLDMKEICHILIQVHLQPKTPREQQGIAELMKEVDVDGSGLLNVDELAHLAQRIHERFQQFHRMEENQWAADLNFSQSQTYELRRAFEALDVDGSGSLDIDEVKRAVRMMHWRVSDTKLERLFMEVDDDGSGQLDFAEFLELMRKVDTEMDPVQIQEAEVDTEKDNGPPPKEVITRSLRQRRTRGHQSVVFAAPSSP